MGTMHVFVFFHETGRSAEDENAIKGHFGSDNVYVLSSELAAVRSSVADPRQFPAFGIGEEEGTGVIFKLNASHRGFYRQAFWDWLKDAIGERNAGD